MNANYDAQQFAEYRDTAFRKDLEHFLNTYHARMKLSHTPDGPKAYDSNCNDSCFLESNLTDKHKLYFIACLAYLIECESKLFNNPKNGECTFDCCNAFCRSANLPIIYSGPGSGCLGARYQLRQFRLIPFDAESRDALWHIIRDASGSTKEAFREFFEGRCTRLEGNKDYEEFLAERAKVYSGLDDYWAEVEKGIADMAEIDVTTLPGYDVWISHQQNHEPSPCSAIDYWHNENGFKRDVDRLFQKLGYTGSTSDQPLKFDPDLSYEWLSDSEESDLYFRACWTYFSAFCQALGPVMMGPLARVIGYSEGALQSVFYEFGLINVELGMTPAKTKKYLYILDEMSWHMEEIVMRFLQGKSERWAETPEYRSFLNRFDGQAKYVWEQMLDHVKYKQRETVKVTRTDNEIKVHLSNLVRQCNIEMVKVESDEGDYYIAKTPVTECQWGALMSQFSGSSDYPMTRATRLGIRLFIERLSLMTGLQFRLPTAKEWIYAAKGGKKSKGYRFAGSDDLEEVAWCRYNSDRKVHSVAKKKPNELGLYDMSGNVWEMTSDRKRKVLFIRDFDYPDDFKWKAITDPNVTEGVDCGGCFHDKENHCEIGDTSTFSDYNIPTDILGFRLACNAPEE